MITTNKHHAFVYECWNHCGVSVDVLNCKLLESHFSLPLQAWQENPGDALKLIAQLRDIRHGKSERERTYAALHWLKQQHPLTLVNNLKQLVGVGYWKDLLQLVARAAMGEEEWERREQQRKAWEERKKGDRKGERRKYWKKRNAARDAFAEEIGVDESEEGKAKLKVARTKAHEGEFI